VLASLCSSLIPAQIRSLGLNYRPVDYDQLLELGGPLEVAPVVNQIEVNPFLYRRDCIDFFANYGIITVAYKPFLRGAAASHPAVVAIAARYEGVSAGGVLLKWLIGKGIIVLPKSTNPNRMAENLRSADEGCLTLTTEDESELDSLYDATSGLAAFEAHFAKRAVQDSEGPTLRLGYGP